jgi:hypothetical protein
METNSLARPQVGLKSRERRESAVASNPVNVRVAGSARSRRQRVPDVSGDDPKWHETPARQQPP